MKRRITDLSSHCKYRHTCCIKTKPI